MIQKLGPQNTTVVTKEFVGALKKTGEKVSFNLSKDGGVLNKVSIKAQSGEAYNYACKKGLDMEYFKDKLNRVCENIKDGKKLFEEIMRFGLNIK